MAKQRKKQRKVAEDRSQVVAALPLACSDETAAVEFMERMRWGDSPACPRCGDMDVYQMRDKAGGRNQRFLWRCKGCKRQFTVRIGTVFEDSRIPLRHWCYAFWKACASKKGISALQIKRETGLCYKSALFLMHRIRWAMAEPEGYDDTKLQGTVEVDEVWIGGKPRRYGDKPYAKKTPVMAMVERGGRVRAMPIGRVTARNLDREMRLHISRSARIMTDDLPAYRRIARRFQGGHYTVRHSNYEYVRGDVSTNTVESFFSLLKRGVYGTFHSVTKRHLHRYVSEFQFRYNTRKLEDGERTRLAIRNADGKRLMYQTPRRQG